MQYEVAVWRCAILCCSAHLQLVGLNLTVTACYVCKLSVCVISAYKYVCGIGGERTAFCV